MNKMVQQIEVRVLELDSWVPKEPCISLAPPGKHD